MTKIVEALPGGDRLYYNAQRHVLRSLPRRIGSADEIRHQLGHVDALVRFATRPLDELEVFEFGAGWDLLNPLVLWSAGVNSQIVIDRQPLMRPELVNIVAADLARLEHPLLVRRPSKRVEDAEDLRQFYGIAYLAPLDTTHTGFPAECVDAVTSTSVLEHVPADQITRIYPELRRILRPDGVVSLAIDYSDHYCHTDPTIGAYNFLRFSSNEWARYNTRTLYQNRLRHHQHVALLTGAGFDIHVDDAHAPESIGQLISDVPLAPEFASMSLSDVGASFGTIVAHPGPRPGMRS
jgi:hypothetical protein